MSEIPNVLEQLAAISSLDNLFRGHDTPYWIFGGWAVDLHLGRVSRPHADIDVAVWADDRAAVATMLRDAAWQHHPEADEDGYTCYKRAGVRLEVAFLAQDEGGDVYTPLEVGRGEWPRESFGDEVGSLDGVRARVVSRASLLADKSVSRADAVAADKDRRDVASLRARRGEPLPPPNGR